MRFSLGQVVATPGALCSIGDQGVNILALVSRHALCDWSEMDADDQKANELALAMGTRVFSAYALPNGERVWIITEADRSSTTVLLASEY